MSEVASVRHQEPVVQAPAPRGRRGRGRVWLVLATIIVVSGGLTFTATLRNSTTFDEIVFVGGGVRGFETGSFDLVPDHPPLMQYIYGLPVWLSRPNLPDESGVPPEMLANPAYRYLYSAAFYWGAGNDPERIALLSRIPAALMALALVFVAFLFTRHHWGDAAGLLAAAFVAFLPDVLAHGGVAYSDVPVTLGFLAGLWATDAAIRTLSLRRALVAGAVAGVAVATKVSAAALLPAAIGLVLCEFAARRRTAAVAAPAAAGPGSDRDWLLRIGGIAAAATVAAYLAIVVVYRGDFLLEQFRWGLEFRYNHMTAGHGANAVLLGERSATGWWYFFPVAFLFKTSAAFHMLLLIGTIVLARRALQLPSRVFASPLRAPVIGLLVFGATLLTSNLNIGFRYALPVLPLLCIIAAVGCWYAWQLKLRLLRFVLVAAVAWTIAHPVWFYPHFLGYISEYGPGIERNHHVLVDSSLDWGQGLLELRDFMRERGIDRVYLSYFGSAYPAGYGIGYVPLASYVPLAAQPPADERPEWVAISATNLQGAYLTQDPFARFRDVEPDAVLGRSIYMYRIGGAERD